MNADTFTLSETADTQMFMLDDDQRELVSDFFASGAYLTDRGAKKLPNGVLGKPVGRNVVFWRPHPNRKPEIVAIIHESYFERQLAPAHAAG